jgi:lysozyme family protein
VDFVFNSGQFYPEKDIQEILNTLFGQHLATDGVFGQQTIDAINSAPQDDLYKDIIIRRQKFYTDIIDAAHERNDHSQDQFLQGWMNRILNIVKYNTQFVD